MANRASRHTGHHIRPVLLDEIASGHFNLIDGHHRLEKARRRGVETLLAYRLTSAQQVRFLTSTSASLARANLRLASPEAGERACGSLDHRIERFGLISWVPQLEGQEAAFGPRVDALAVVDLIAVHTTDDEPTLRLTNEVVARIHGPFEFSVVPRLDRHGFVRVGMTGQARIAATTDRCDRVAMAPRMWLSDASAR